MEKLAKQMGELVASLQEAKGTAVKRVSELEKKLVEVSKLQSDLIAERDDLDVRAAALLQKEAPAKMLEEAKKIRSENKESLQAIDTAQKAFAKERADFNTHSAKIKSELGANRDLLTKELEVLKADRKQLEAAKKTYKDDVLAKLKVAV